MNDHTSDEDPQQFSEDDSERTQEVGDGFYEPDADIDWEVMREKLTKRSGGGGKYVLMDEVARGGMGTIVQVYDQDLQRYNVLKVIRPDIIADADLFRRFVVEARITATLEHPNIVPVHDLGLLADEKLFFSMKYVQGEELAHIIRMLRDGDPDYVNRYDRYRLLTIFRKVCDAVAFAHSHSIIHRDIKPDNIMVAPYGEVLLMDWGLARRERSPEEDWQLQKVVEEAENRGEKTHITAYGMVKGTPAFMAPEQAMGQTDLIDRRTDVFLLGATLYALCTYHAPYVAEDLYEMIDVASEGRFQPPDQRAPELQIPDQLCRIVMRAMARDPDHRYQSVDELSADLDDMMAGRAHSQTRIFRAGELMMTEGEIGREAYVLIDGEVEVFKSIQEQEVTLVHLHGGDVVGEMAMISNAPRSASVRAVTDTEAVIITGENVTEALRNLPPWMGQVVEALVERLRAANQNVHPLMRGDCTYHVISQFRLLYTFWGRPVQDEETGDQCIAAGIAAIIDEIALMLCLPRERVFEIVAELLESTLVAAWDTENCFVPNLDLFNAFIDYVRQRLEHATSFPAVPDSTLCAVGPSLVFHHGPPETVPPGATPVYQAPIGEILGGDDENQILARFDQIYDQIHHVPATSPSLHPPAVADDARDNAPDHTELAADDPAPELGITTVSARERGVRPVPRPGARRHHGR